MQPSRDLSRLVEIMARLRDRDTGCPWDLEQDFKSISAYTIEEAYEVADAIEREDFPDLRDELGDLILQPVYQAQLATEQGLFDIGDVIFAITSKLIRRHPHVFGDTAATDAANAKDRWDEIKASERAAKAESRAREPSILDDVPNTLPALMRAEKLSRRAAKVDFDWPDWRQTLDKVTEELQETKLAAEGGDKARIAEEVGDLLFAAANLARKLGIEPEAALRNANSKFSRRFAYVEQRAREDGIHMEDAGLDRLDGYWNEVRASDKSGA